MTTRTGIQRRALGSLQMNVPLWMRQEVKTPAITYDQENELQVDFGIAVGLYDEHEVRALTNYSITQGAGPTNAVADSDDDDGIQTLARDLNHRRWEDRLGRERTELQGQQSSDDDDDDIDDEVDDDEMGGHYGELADEDLEPTDEFEYDQQTDMHNHLAANNFDPIAMGLKEINNLAHFSVSSHKPGNGVQELLSDDLDKYWQSDGQQPHLLTIHFLRRVEIRAIRFYVDYNQDESYTPTFVILSAGTGHHDLIEFASMPLTNPVGWQDVDLSDVGGGEDGQSLCCYIVQMQVKENHQNGKDTHIRGIKLYAIDENANANNEDATLSNLSDLIDRGIALGRDDMDEDESDLRSLLRLPKTGGIGIGGMSIPDFMRDPEIR